jgi:hypothetical protein
MPTNLSLLDLSENPFEVASTRGKFFIYMTNLYIVYVEQDKKIRIKTGLTVSDIYDGSLYSDEFVIYDVYLDSNLLYICGKYGSHGFHLCYNILNSNLTSFTRISSFDLISHIFVINSKVHLLHRTNSSIGLSFSSNGTFYTIPILSDLTPQKNAYIKDYLYDNSGNLYIFVQQEDDITSYLNLKVFYHLNYDANSSFVPSNSILLKTNNKHTIFSSISLMNGVNCLLTIVDDFINDLSTVQQNTLYVYTMNNLVTNQNYTNSLTLSGVSILSLKNMEYKGYNHLFGFCYQGSYENANLKYLVVPLENNISWNPNPQFATKSSSMGYISTDSSVEILSFQNKIYIYLETIPIETSPTNPPITIIGNTRGMISDFSYREIGNTIVGGYVDQSILNNPSGTIINFIDPALGVDISCGIYYGDGLLNLGQMDASGAQISVRNASSDKIFIFGTISNSLKESLEITGDYAVILKVVDASSGQVIENLNPTLSLYIYLDSSNGNIIQLKVNGNGNVAGTGTLSGPEIINDKTKYKYTSSLTKGNGYLSMELSNSTASSGSDPHITTIFGTKYDFHPSTRKNYTLFQSKDIKVNSHFTGFKSGVFYDKVMIECNKNKDKIDIDFNNKKIKGSSKYIKISEDQTLSNLKYKNFTSNKSVGKVFEPKQMTKIEYQGKNPMEMFVDFRTRYVHFRFPDTFPPLDEMKGLIVKEATRLD